MDEEPFNPEYTEVDRALDVATQTEPNGEVYTYRCIHVYTCNFGLCFAVGCYSLLGQVEISPVRRCHLGTRGNAVCLEYVSGYDSVNECISASVGGH